MYLMYNVLDILIFIFESLTKQKLYNFYLKGTNRNVGRHKQVSFPLVD